MVDFQEGALLKDFTNIKIGGPAEFLFIPENIEELKTAIVWSKMHDHPITVLSGGSNVLISDEGIEGLVIVMKKYSGIASRIEGDDVVIEAKAGTSKALLLKEFLKYKLAPAEFISGLPGDVGGGVFMNAGLGDEHIKPREFCEIVDWVEVLRDELVIKFEKKDLEFFYRKSKGWQPGIITKVGFRWPNKPDESVAQRVRDYSKSRMQRQPLEYPNLGSVFKNPAGYKSGKLIDECGLKGYQIGGAQISEKHGNFIINRGDAKAKDALQLIKHIQDAVLEQKGVSLEIEWVLLGF